MAGLGLEETELRLGLPGDGEAVKNSCKRGFEETIDLKLKLPTIGMEEAKKDGEMINTMKRSGSLKNLAAAVVVAANDPEKPPALKAQAVGWPPVRSFRKNIMTVQSNKNNKDDMEKSGSNAAFIKVSMDGAPYLRKIDLKMYKSYKELSSALEKMFSSFTTGGNNGSDYLPTYEDKDGDWMLVGDVPWEMFVDSCKRLRIMKGSEAIGLAPKAKEKCKNKA